MPEFPPDEFDSAADERAPVGVHRKRRGWWRAVAVTLLVFLVGGALAYGVVIYLWRAQDNEGVPPLDDIPLTTITATQEETPDATASPSATATPSQTPSPTPTVDPVQFAAPVTVLNGAGIAGLAGRNQEKLAAAGFTAATADDLTGAKPASNTVRYSDVSLESTAAKVAEVLGIATIEFGVVAEGDIAVLLVTDPTA